MFRQNLEKTGSLVPLLPCGGCFLPQQGAGRCLFNAAAAACFWILSSPLQRRSFLIGRLFGLPRREALKSAAVSPLASRKLNLIAALCSSDVILFARWHSWIPASEQRLCSFCIFFNLGVIPRAHEQTLQPAWSACLPSSQRALQSANPPPARTC